MRDDPNLNHSMVRAIWRTWFLSWRVTRFILGLKTEPAQSIESPISRWNQAQVDAFLGSIR